MYRGYKVHPHATVHRSGSSWLPRLALEDAEGNIGTHPEMVEHALTAFAKAWDTNANNNGTLHIALQLLRSQERGTHQADPSLLYLRERLRRYQHCRRHVGRTEPQPRKTSDDD